MKDIPFYEEHCQECGWPAYSHTNTHKDPHTFVINQIEHKKWARIYELKAELQQLQPMGTFTNNER